MKLLLIILIIPSSIFSYISIGFIVTIIFLKYFRYPVFNEYDSLERYESYDMYYDYNIKFEASKDWKKYFKDPYREDTIFSVIIWPILLLKRIIPMIIKYIIGKTFYKIMNEIAK